MLNAGTNNPKFGSGLKHDEILLILDPVGDAVERKYRRIGLVRIMSDGASAVEASETVSLTLV